ncbi:MAG: CPBP family intramembrane metalloprotease [Chloroflexi bacterium]|nr:CPBP family intramembrane metalloprotease [Chloroflexota bacterium]
MNKSESPSITSQHTLLQSFLLHITPGTLATVAFIALKPILDSVGYPPLLAFLLAILLIDLPVLLGIMLYEGDKLNGRLSLNGVVLYREKVSWGMFALVFIGAFVVVYLLITLITPINTFLTERLFSGLPKWIFLEEQSQYLAYTKNILVITFTFQLVVTGIILPWAEELYFRGYLLPRISRYGSWTPLIGGLFFGLYHSWQPFGFLTVFLLGTALGYIVMWKRDIRLSISLHVFANVFARLAFLMVALSM